MRRAHYIINLTFHGVGTPARAISPEEEPMWIDRGSFEAILDLIANRPAAWISFDDGNASDVELALPALVSRGLKASFFVLADRLGQPGSLGCEDIRAMRRAGMEIGLHGMAHRPWRGMDDAQLEVEIVEARKQIESALDERITAAACPFGAYGRRVLHKLREQGFERVYTSDRGPADANAWMQARNTIRAGDNPARVAQLLENGRRGPFQRAKLLAKRYCRA